jgi:hypothetical protein
MIMTGSGPPPKDRPVEIFVDGKWVRGQFVECDYCWDGEEEYYWFDYFSLEDGSTMPDDVTSGDDLPPWREIEKDQK